MPAILSPAPDRVATPKEPRPDLRKTLQGPFACTDDLARVMRAVLRDRHDELPLPGGGATAARWKTLALVASADLSLAKIFESHVDALAILRELGGAAEAGKLLAVWAAEDPRTPLVFDARTARLNGAKPWCSGAPIVDAGILTARTPDGKNVLVQAAMHQPGIEVQPCAWANAGISAAETSVVSFRDAPAIPIGSGNAYLERPGFWHGGAGIAAVWYGGAVAVAETLAASPRVHDDPHAAAHFGEIYSELAALRALLIQTAAWIDAHPREDAMVPARALRATAETVATGTLLRVGRALGAAPLCANPEHARRVSDLEIFLRQSHAERDLAALGQAAAQSSWEKFW